MVKRLGGVVVCSLAIGGCGGDARRAVLDAEVALEEVADAVLEETADASSDLAPEVPSDAAVDASVEPDAQSADTDVPDPDAVADTSTDVAADTSSDAVSEVVGDIAGDAAVDLTPRDPVAVFGDRYWNVYRPHFLAQHYQDGRVTDRREGGQPTFGDNTIWMGYTLSTFVHEYRAARQPESLAYIARILEAYAELDALPANPSLGYLIADPLDGYVYRSDRGPDYESNWCVLVQGVCVPQLGTRNNEPSGDQILGTLRALSDVTTCPLPLVHEGRDLKALARAHAERLGDYLVRTRFQMENILGEPVARGPDQRWVSWAMQEGVARITGLPKSRFEASWTLGPLTIEPTSHEPIGLWFIRYAIKFTRSCVAGQQVDLGPLIGVPVTAQIACNEFNIGLGGDAGVIALDANPASPRWFSTVIDRADLVREGNAIYALYARHRFGDDDPALLETAARFLDAPATPPRGDNLDPNGWCVAWRWAKDFDDPQRCVTAYNPFITFSGLDYMLARAMASAYGELPE